MCSYLDVLLLLMPVTDCAKSRGEWRWEQVLTGVVSGGCQPVLTGLVSGAASPCWQEWWVGLSARAVRRVDSRFQHMQAEGMRGAARIVASGGDEGVVILLAKGVQEVAKGVGAMDVMHLVQLIINNSDEGIMNHCPHCPNFHYCPRSPTTLTATPPTTSQMPPLPPLPSRPPLHVIISNWFPNPYDRLMVAVMGNPPQLGKPSSRPVSVSPQL